MNLVPLTEYAAIINDAHRSAFKCAQAAIEHARVAGDHLIKAKAALKHGEWLPWLAENCEVSESQAQRYMKVSSNWDRIKSTITADSTIEGALRSLQAEAKTREPRDLPKAASGAELPNPAPTRDFTSPPNPASETDLPAEPNEVAKLREQLADREERLAEMSSQQKEMLDELTFLQKIEDEGDKLSAALAEVKRLQEQVRVLRERLIGLENEKHAATKAAKSATAKAERLEKEIKRLRGE